ncbi:hypothetical protein HDV02_002948, partial [Globomyces sp. JEL0801]
MSKTVTYLQSLPSVRQRAKLLLDNPDCLQNFDVDLSKLPEVADFICKLVKRDYQSLDDIPPHSRWRHFEASTNKTVVDRISPLLLIWKSDQVDLKESVRRLLDLFVTSVLLDAGAGAKWVYRPPSEPGLVYNRSEGLGIASLDLFLSGALSSNKEIPHQCDAKGLSDLTTEQLASVFQVSEENPLVGLEGRCALLQRLGKVVVDHPEFFKGSDGSSRPGNLLDYLLSHETTTETNGKYHVNIETLWTVVIKGFSGVWPATRTIFEGVSLGDVWPSAAMTAISKLDSKPTKDYPGSESFVCFHKLSQWLTYSLMEPLARANIVFTGVENMTGLAEYRNGGLFVDMNVITLKSHVLNAVPSNTIPRYQVYDDVVIEWRALTVALLDQVAILVRKQLGMTEIQLPLAKVLEAGTWKAGREIAAKLRPDTKGPPIEVISD